MAAQMKGREVEGLLESRPQGAGKQKQVVRVVAVASWRTKADGMPCRRGKPAGHTKECGAT